MKVCREINRRREYAFVLLALGLSVKLLPPLAQIVQFWLEVDQYLYLLAAAVKGVSYSRIHGRWIILDLGARCSLALHIGCTLNQLTDIESGNCNGQKAYRCRP